MYDEKTILSVTTGGVTYTIETIEALTCEEFFRQCAYLAKAQGYVLTNIRDALLVVHDETDDECRVIVKREDC